MAKVGVEKEVRGPVGKTPGEGTRAYRGKEKAEG
jgi:hypothetical protein